MEAKDVGDTVTLYLPQAVAGSEPHVVFRERTKVGSFATPGDSIRFAMDLAASIHEERHVSVRLRIEDETGLWETRNALEPLNMP